MNEGKIIKYGVEKFTEGLKGPFALKCRYVTLDIYTLFEMMDGFQEVVTEVPVGSQSSAAAWYLSAIQASIQMYAYSNKIKYTPCKENEIKKAMHGKAKKVDKSLTIKFVIDNYPEFSYIMENQPKYKQEALADTLAVFHYSQQNA
jgi:hypothetical protein